jgi:hypothetical protein
MKVVLLALHLLTIASFAAFAPSSRSQGRHHLFHQSPRDHEDHSSRPRLCTLNAMKVPLDADEEELLPEVNIQAAIYDVANFLDQQTSELRKAGVQLTKAMRNLEVEQQAEIEFLDELIAVTKRKKKYVKFAYKCFKWYTANGTLSWTFSKESNQELHYEEVKELFTNKFDRDLFNRCIAKHGFVYIKSGEDSDDYSRNKYKLELGFFSEESQGGEA